MVNSGKTSSTLIEFAQETFTQTCFQAGPPVVVKTVILKEKQAQGAAVLFCFFFRKNQ